jgi:hypothetical protein
VFKTFKISFKKPAINTTDKVPQKLIETFLFFKDMLQTLGSDPDPNPVEIVSARQHRIFDLSSFHFFLPTCGKYLFVMIFFLGATSLWASGHPGTDKAGKSCEFEYDAHDSSGPDSRILPKVSIRIRIQAP